MDREGILQVVLKNYPGADEWLRENLLKHKGRKMVVCITLLTAAGLMDRT